MIKYVYMYCDLIGHVEVSILHSIKLLRRPYIHSLMHLYLYYFTAHNIVMLKLIYSSRNAAVLANLEGYLCCAFVAI